MRVFLRVLYLLSLLQIVAGGTAYVAGVLGYDVSSLVPVGIGIAGVLVSFVAVVVGLKICSKHRLTTHNGQNDSEEIVFRAAPRWVKVFAAIAAVVFGTTLITVRIVDEGGRVDRLDDGSFALKSQGRLIRRLTETEYRRCCSNESLMPAAVCMAAASFGLMAVAGAMRIRRCPAPRSRQAGTFDHRPRR